MGKERDEKTTDTKQQNMGKGIATYKKAKNILK